MHLEALVTTVLLAAACLCKAFPNTSTRFDSLPSQQPGKHVEPLTLQQPWQKRLQLEQGHPLLKHSLTTPAGLDKIWALHGGTRILLPKQLHLFPVKHSYLAMCTIFKNVPPLDMVEWLAHHMRLGVTHFYLYENSTFIRRELEAFIQSNHITYLQIVEAEGAPERPTTQFEVYNHCIRHFGNRHQFMALMDADEYLWLENSTYTNVPSLLRERYSNFAAVGVNWKIFGPCNHEERPNATVLRSYTCCHAKEPLANVSKHIKTILNTSYGKTNATSGGSPHEVQVASFEMANGTVIRPGFTVDELFRPVRGSFTISPTMQYISIMHHMVKSHREFQDKLARGYPDGNKPRLAMYNDTLAIATDDCTLPSYCENPKHGAPDSHARSLQEPQRHPLMHPLMHASRRHPNSERMWSLHDGTVVVLPRQDHLFPVDPSYLSACVMFKDVLPLYMLEWVAHHMALGWTHFYLYEHNATFTVRRELEAFIQAGYITFLQVVEEPDNPKRGTTQIAVYNHCIKHYGKQSAWMALMDGDEYFWLEDSSHGSIAAMLKEEYSFSPALGVNWKNYGPSGHEKRPNGTVLHSYTKCQTSEALPLEIKTILHSAYGRTKAEAHGTSHQVQIMHFSTEDGTQKFTQTIDERYVPVNGPFMTRPSTKYISLMHHGIRSREDFAAKLERGYSGWDRVGWEMFENVAKIANADCALPVYEENV